MSIGPNLNNPYEIHGWLHSTNLLIFLAFGRTDIFSWKILKKYFWILNVVDDSENFANIAKNDFINILNSDNKMIAMIFFFLYKKVVREI